MRIYRNMQTHKLLLNPSVSKEIKKLTSVRVIHSGGLAIGSASNDRQIIINAIAIVERIYSAKIFDFPAARKNVFFRYMNGEAPVVYGAGSQTRDFTYIEDIVKANLSLLETNVADGEAMNVGSTNNIVIKTLAEEGQDQLVPRADLEFADRYDSDAEHTRADTFGWRSCLAMNRVIQFGGCREVRGVIQAVCIVIIGFELSYWD